MTSVEELCVSLRPGDNDVHPNPHGLRRRSHHVVQPVMGLHTEGQRWVGALKVRGGRRRGEKGREENTEHQYQNITLHKTQKVQRKRAARQTVSPT